MQEGCAADGSDLAVAEKAGHRYVAEVFSEDVGVEVGTPLEPSPRPRQEKRRDPETDSGRVFSQRGSMVGRSSAEVSPSRRWKRRRISSCRFSPTAMAPWRGSTPMRARIRRSPPVAPR